MRPKKFAWLDSRPGFELTGHKADVCCWTDERVLQGSLTIFLLELEQCWFHSHFNSRINVNGDASCLQCRRHGMAS